MSPSMAWHTCEGITMSAGQEEDRRRTGGGQKANVGRQKNYGTVRQKQRAMDWNDACFLFDGHARPMLYRWNSCVRLSSGFEKSF